MAHNVYKVTYRRWNYYQRAYCSHILQMNRLEFSQQIDQWFPWASTPEGFAFWQRFHIVGTVNDLSLREFRKLRHLAYKRAAWC